MIGDKVYFCSFEGIFLFQNLRFVKAFHTETSFFVAFNINNRLYLQNVKKGLAYIDEQDSLRLIKGSDVFADNYKVYNIFPHNNKIIAASRKRGFYIFDPAEISTKETVTFTKFPVEIDSLIIKNSFVPVSRTGDNKMVIGTTSAGAVVADNDGKLLNLIDKQSGLQDNNIWDTKIDRQQGLWLPLNNGISRANLNLPLTYWNEQHGLVGNKVYAITKFENTIYIGTPQGVFYVAGNRLEKVQGSDNQVWQFLTLETENKKVLLYAYNGGISEIKDKKATLLFNDLSSYTLIQPFAKSSLFYAGSRSGVKVLSYQNGKITPKDTLKTIVGEARKMVKHGNDVWVEVSTKGAVLMKNISPTDLKPTTVKQFGKEQGLTIGSDLGIVSYQNKVLLSNGNNFFTTTSNDDLVQEKIYNQTITEKNISVIVLQQDQQNNLWMGGVYEKNGIGSTLVGYISDTNNKLTWQSKVFKGLPSMEINAILPDSNQVVWIGGSEGLFRYDGKQKFEPLTDFTTLIRKISLGTDSVIFHGNFADFLGKNHADTTNQLFKILDTQPRKDILGFDYAFNDLVFDYACPFFDNENETEYSYFLEGFDTNWSEWTKETKKEYTNLFEKTYKFRVKARNVYGDESKEAVYEFSILPPWYRTWWAYLLYVLVAGLAVYWIVKLNTARLKQQNEKLEKTVKERTAEVVHKNQELEQQKEEILAQRDAISEKNQTLEVAYQEINQQKEEIEAQRDNLELANQEINQQKEEIEAQRDSISEQKTQVEKAYQNIQTLSEIGQKITAILDIKTIIHTVYENVNQLMPAEAFGIGLYYGRTKELLFDGFVEKGEILPTHFHQLDEKVLAVLCYNAQKQIIINDLETEYHNYFDEPIQVVKGDIPKSLIYLPLTIENKAIGVITVQSFKAHAYSNFHLTMLQSLASYIAIALDNAGAYETIDAKNAQITGSIRYAQTIQQAILPSKEILHKYFPQNYVLYKPKDVVSGDFYWLYASHNKENKALETVYLGIMDCTGHGVPGAFMSMIGNTLLNKIVSNTPNILPAKLLDELHEEIKIALHQDSEANKDGMDVGLLQLDYRNKSTIPTAFFAGAKRPLITINSKGELTEYRGSRKSIGGRQKEDVFFDNKTVNLAKDDVLYLTTDGYIDQNNQKRESIGSAGLKEILLSIYKEDVNTQGQILEEELKTHQGEEEQRDDISLIIIKY